MKKLICFLIGHDDWVMDGIGLITQDELYERWNTYERSCRRCGVSLKP